MFGWFRKPKDISEVALQRKKIVVHGVPFEIKKIDVLNYLDGSKVMLQSYDTYKTGAPVDKAALEASHKKLKEHYRDVILSGVVSPKLDRKKDEDGFFVEDLFENFEFATEVYRAVLEFTFGKKKLRLPASRASVSQT